jgi:hypothetical protein
MTRLSLSSPGVRQTPPSDEASSAEATRRPLCSAGVRRSRQDARRDGAVCLKSLQDVVAPAETEVDRLVTLDRTTGAKAAAVRIEPHSPTSTRGSEDSTDSTHLSPAVAQEGSAGWSPGGPRSTRMVARRTSLDHPMETHPRKPTGTPHRVRRATGALSAGRSCRGSGRSLGELLRLDAERGCGAQTILARRCVDARRSPSDVR